MNILTRSKTSVLSQLSALRKAIDNELACKLPNYRKIRGWEIRFTECAEELAGREIREWRRNRPLSTKAAW